MKAIITLLFFISATITFASELAFYDARQFPLLGTVAKNEKVTYTRLPDSLKNLCRPPVWNLGRNTSGMAVRFASNSTSIGAKWDAWQTVVLNHMTPTVIRGLDLYMLQDDGTWTFVNSGRPNTHERSTKMTMIGNMEPKMREYMLYLPLYDGIDSLYIGIDSLARIEQPKVLLPKVEKPIIFYGTSILQGGCASRPGMSHTNIIQRRINRDVLNYGFSGHGQLDYDIAELIAKTPAGMIVLDYIPNVNMEQLENKMEKFYRIIRKSQPNVPILFVESPIFTHMRFDKVIHKEVTRKNIELKRQFEMLKKAGEKNIYYLKGDDILGHDNEGTIDAIHFTDLGFMRYADLLYPIIKKRAIK